MKDETVECEVRNEMTNEHVGNMSINKCVIISMELNTLNYTSTFASRRFWTPIFPQKIYFDLYVNRLIGEYIRYSFLSTMQVQVSGWFQRKTCSCIISEIFDLSAITRVSFAVLLQMSCWVQHDTCNCLSTSFSLLGFQLCVSFHRSAIASCSCRYLCRAGSTRHL